MELERQRRAEEEKEKKKRLDPNAPDYYEKLAERHAFHQPLRAVGGD